jgi:hypothetical protein
LKSRSIPGVLRGAVALLGFLAVVGGCAAKQAATDDAALPASDPPLVIGGERVLVLPLSAQAGIPAATRETLDRELLFAFEERAPHLVWIGPEQLRRTLARSPGIAAARPDALAVDAIRIRPSGRHVLEPLAAELRRYGAMVNARLVVVPQRLSLGTDEAELHWMVVDVRRDAVLWLGSERATFPTRGDAEAEAAAAASFAERAAARMLSSRLAPDGGR